MRSVLIFLALFFPVAVLLLLVFMERVEDSVQRGPLGLDFQTFLDNARPEEVETFISEGFGPALDRYWKRRKHQPV